MQIERGDVRVVELELGADVDDQRAVLLRLLDLARRERVDVDRLDLRAGRGCAPTMFSKFGGWGGRPAIAFSTNASSSAIWSIGECWRSKPIVEETFRSMPGPPQSEPPRCPGQTSHVSGSGSSFSWSERKMSRAPSLLSTARSGRAMSPTKSVSPVSTAQGSSPRSVSISANAVCSGRWPGVWSARTRTLPSSSSQPSSNGSWS